MPGPFYQQGNADPQAASTATGGVLVAWIGYLGVNEWVAIGGLVISAITCGAYVWRARQTVRIARDQQRETEHHHKRLRDIQQGDE